MGTNYTTRATATLEEIQEKFKHNRQQELLHYIHFARKRSHEYEVITTNIKFKDIEKGAGYRDRVAANKATYKHYFEMSMQWMKISVLIEIEYIEFLHRRD